MANRAQTAFLEEWLRSNSSSTSSNSILSRQSPPSSAQSIIQAWANLRDSLQQQSFNANHLQSLRTLISSQLSLYVADPQAKLLLSILSSPNISLPQESYPLFLRLLYVWSRKSSRQSPLVIDSAVQVLLQIFTERFYSNKSIFFFSGGVILLGSLSFLPSTSEKSKILCLELLCRLLEEEYQLIGLSEDVVSHVLSGIGYGLSSTVNVYFVRIVDSLLGIWGKIDGPCGGVSCGLMILHLIEWVLSNSNFHSSGTINLFRREVLGDIKPHYASFAVIMAAAGVLRALNRSGSSSLMELRVSAERQIEIVSRDLATRTGSAKYSGTEPRDSILLQCISLALARAGPVSYRAPQLVCIASALVTEVFPLRRIYTNILNLSSASSSELEHDEVRKHLGSTIFKEAGAISGAFCNQYLSADEEIQHIVENLMWDYCQYVYVRHRQVALMLRGRQDMLIGDIEKIAESAFLMVVMFALAVTKHKLGGRVAHDIQLKLSVEILVSFSCMEYFRRIRLPEYMDTIRAVVISVQENESACISFVESMPSYDDLTNGHGASNSLKLGYLWSTDEVQTARILFYLRVIPTGIDVLPTSVFRKRVVPTMFLFMGHPNGKVARSAHSMFVAFISSAKDPNQDERLSLKEQLVFYYMERSLEGYPDVTPFEGMASGVAALVRHLPAGSPSTFYCIHSLVAKASSMCSMVNTQEGDIWKNWEGELEMSKKMLELLLRLLSLVDIQVLPSLMKLLVQLIIQLPPDGQNMVLSQLYQQVAESDDVVRKPSLVSWLQSLSYLCSEATGRRVSKEVQPEVYTVSANNPGSVILNRVCARF